MKNKLRNSRWTTRDWLYLQQSRSSQLICHRAGNLPDDNRRVCALPHTPLVGHLESLSRRIWRSDLVRKEGPGVIPVPPPNLVNPNLTSEKSV